MTSSIIKFWEFKYFSCYFFLISSRLWWFELCCCSQSVCKSFLFHLKSVCKVLAQVRCIHGLSDLVYALNILQIILHNIGITISCIQFEFKISYGCCIFWPLNGWKAHSTAWLLIHFYSPVGCCFSILSFLVVTQPYSHRTSLFWWWLQLTQPVNSAINLN